MRTVLGLLVLTTAAAAPADDPPPPARWGIRHTFTLEHPPTALAVGNTWAAVGQPNGTVVVWELESGKELARFLLPGTRQPVRSLTGPADGTVLFGIDGEKTGFRWDWSKPGGGQFTRRPFDGQVLAIAADGKQWAVFDGEKVRMVAADLTTEPFKPSKVVECELPAAICVDPTDPFTDLGVEQWLTRFKPRFQAIFPPDGNGLIFAGDWMGVIRWDDRGVLKYRNHALIRPQALSVSSNGVWLAAAGNEFNTVTEYELRTYLIDDRLTGKILDSIRPEKRQLLPVKARGRPLQLNGVDLVAETVLTFHPRSPVLASGGTDGTVRLWDIPDFLQQPGEVRWKRWNGKEPDRPAEALTGHTATVRGIGFSPDGRFLITAADDRKVLVWLPKP